MPASPGRRLDGGRPVSAQGWGEGTPVPPEPCECFPGGGPGAVPLAGASAVSACFWKSQCRPIGRFLRAVAGQGALCLRGAGEIANAAISWLLVGRSFTGAHAARVVRGKINDDIVGTWFVPNHLWRKTEAPVCGEEEGRCGGPGGPQPGLQSGLLPAGSPEGRGPPAPAGPGPHVGWHWVSTTRLIAGTGDGKPSQTGGVFAALWMLRQAGFGNEKIKPQPANSILSMMQRAFPAPWPVPEGAEVGQCPLQDTAALERMRSASCGAAPAQQCWCCPDF